MEKIIGSLLPFVVYFTLAAIILLKYGREADRNLLLLLYSVSAVYLSAILIYGFGFISETTVVFDYVVLKLYFLTTFMPLLFLRRHLFSGDGTRVFAFSAAVVTLLLLSVDFAAITGFRFVTFSSLSRVIMLVSAGIFIFSYVAVCRLDKDVRRSSFSHIAIMAVCNYSYVFYGEIAGYMNYIVAVLCFAGIHIWLSLVIEKRKPGVAYRVVIPEHEDIHLLKDDGDASMDMVNVDANQNKPLKDRLLDYFETEKPFLSKDLTMEEVAARLFTNKSYLSKTINVEMNKNFRELVNTFRIREAMRLYLKNQDISINELRELSGFNNNASFTSAFKLITGSTPGEWCRNIKKS